MGMVTRRSTDVVAVEHPQVALALKAIREHYRAPMTAEGIISGVPMDAASCMTRLSVISDAVSPMKSPA